MAQLFDSVNACGAPRAAEGVCGRWARQSGWDTEADVQRNQDFFLGLVCFSCFSLIIVLLLVFVIHPGGINLPSRPEPWRSRPLIEGMTKVR